MVLSFHGGHPTFTVLLPWLLFIIALRVNGQGVNGDGARYQTDNRAHFFIIISHI